MKTYLNSIAIFSCILSSAFGAEPDPSPKQNFNCSDLLVAVVNGRVEVSEDPRFVEALRKLKILPATLAEALRREFEVTDGRSVDHFLELPRARLRQVSVKDLGFPERVVKELDIHEIRTLSDLYNRFLLQPWAKANEGGKWIRFKPIARSVHSILHYFLMHSDLAERPAAVQDLTADQIKNISISKFGELCEDAQVAKHWEKRDVQIVGAFEASGSHFNLYESARLIPFEQRVILWKKP